MEWPTAYHWPTKQTITIAKALNFRKEDRLEIGDCWCHYNCYISNPRSGMQLFPRDGKPTPHFWRGPGKIGKIINCDFEFIRKNKGESERYSQFFHDLQNWLKQKDAKSILNLSSFENVNSMGEFDFILNHNINTDYFVGQSYILIKHKNRKRHTDNPQCILIDLSQWSDEHLASFESYGKRKVTEEYNLLKERLNQKNEITIQNEIETAVKKKQLKSLHDKKEQFLPNVSNLIYELNLAFKIEDIINDRDESSSNNFEGMPVQKLIIKAIEHTNSNQYESKWEQICNGQDLHNNLIRLTKINDIIMTPLLHQYGKFVTIHRDFNSTMEITFNNCNDQISFYDRMKIKLDNLFKEMGRKVYSEEMYRIRTDMIRQLNNLLAKKIINPSIEHILKIASDLNFKTTNLIRTLEQIPRLKSSMKSFDRVIDDNIKELVWGGSNPLAEPTESIRVNIKILRKIRNWSYYRKLELINDNKLEKKVEISKFFDNLISK